MVTDSKTGVTYCDTIKAKKPSLLLGCENGRVLSLDTLKMKVLHEYSIGSGSINNLKVIGNKIIAGIYKEIVKIFGTPLRNKVDVLSFPFNRDIQLVSNSKLLISSDSPNQCKLVDLDNKDNVTKLCQFQNYTPNEVCILENLIAVIGHSKGLIQCWDYNKNKIYTGVQGHEKGVSNLIKLKVNTGILSVGFQGEMKIWNLASDFKVTELNLFNVNKNKASFYQVSSDTKSHVKELSDGRIIYARNDHKICLFDLRSNNISLIGNETSHTNLVHDFYQLNQYSVLSCSKDSTIMKWDLRKSDEPLKCLKYDSVVMRFES